MFGALSFALQASAQVVEFAQPAAHGAGPRLGLSGLVLQVAERRIDGGAFGADVLGQRVIQTAERPERRIFARAAVERVGQRGAYSFRARAVDLGLTLPDACRVEKNVERYLEVRLARGDELADREFGRNVVAVFIEHANRLGIALEVAMNFEDASIVERVAQRARVRAAAPRPARVAFVLAAHAVE